MSDDFPVSVSVIVPAHNAEATVLEAVKSALNQELIQAEVIVCDDASKDNTRDLVGGFSDARLRLISNDSNFGPGRSRDRAISASTGEWVALLDADDAWAPNRIGRLLEAARTTRADVIFDDLMLCHDTERGLVPWRAVHGTHAFGGHGPEARTVSTEDYIRSPRLIAQPIVRTDFIRKNDIRHSERKFAEDAEFILRLAHAGARFCYFPEPMYLYRITPGSLTARARDPALMRHCLRECSQWTGWSGEALLAFDQKIAALKRTEALYALVEAVKSGNVASALGLLASSPGVLRELPSRALRQIDYQWHRRRHGGHKR